jgi:type II secretion system protein H
MNYNNIVRPSIWGANGDGLMKRVRGWQHEIAPAEHKSAGFTLIELIVCVVIVVLMTAMAVPLLQNAIGNFKLRGAISSITGAIQSTRYQAINQGIPYQIVFDSTAKTYQIQNQPGGAGAYVNVCNGGLASCPVPMAGDSSSVTLNTDTTLKFSPGGKVSSTNNVAMTMLITYTGKPVETIKVSSYGNINVTP